MKRIIIHGGCGERESTTTPFELYHQHLSIIISSAYQKLHETNNAIVTALYCAKLLETDDIFNAGTGSRLQQDGVVRMSASIMDSSHNKFAGVINIENVEYPSEVAYNLLNQHNSVLCGLNASKYAHEVLQMPKYNPITPKRYQEYLDLKAGKTGTIGVVALDDNGVICAITSTGGAGYEYPGRVGDSATVAGNYASPLMGISCTGIGEHIVNLAVASRVHTRVLDGMELQVAVDKVISESDALNDYVGLIALDSKGNLCHGSTKVAQTLYAYHNGAKVVTFYS